jgi:hypothetical protein
MIELCVNVYWLAILSGARIRVNQFIHNVVCADEGLADL